MSLAVTTLLALAINHQQVRWPQTTAEKYNYERTSSSGEVRDFLKQLELAGAPIRMLQIGRSYKEKPIQLVVCHPNPEITPAQAKALGLPVVYIQANIHAGEVEGKEAVLRMLREIAQGQHPSFKGLVLLVQPIYNADGNDAWGDNEKNRGHQDGPAQVGERANGQGLDLNRDAVKAVSPEMQAALSHIYNTWDPDVVMDLHTTNGTRHAYVLTYSAGMNPTGDKAILDYTRNHLLNQARKDARSKKGWEFFDYGDAYKTAAGWEYRTFAADPRYVTNYASVRNRISILSEAASFQPFKLRVESTHWFVVSLLEQIAKDAKTITKLTRDADANWIKLASTKGTEIGINFEIDHRGTEKVKIEMERDPKTINHMKAPTEFRELDMTIYDRFKTTKTAPVPAAYTFSGQPELVKLLMLHGIHVYQVIDSMLVLQRAEQFNIDTVKVAENPFQGRNLISITSSRKPGRHSITSQDYIVPTSQQLGLLAFHLLEPESKDGAMTWGFLGVPTPNSKYPVVKLMQNPNMPMVRLQ